MPNPIDHPALIFLAHKDDLSFVERLIASLQILRPDLDPQLRNVGLRPFRAGEGTAVVFISQSLQQSGYLSEFPAKSGKVLFATRDAAIPSGFPGSCLIVDLSDWDDGGHGSGLLELVQGIDALARDVDPAQAEPRSYEGLTEAMLVKVD